MVAKRFKMNAWNGRNIFTFLLDRVKEVVEMKINILVITQTKRQLMDSTHSKALSDYLTYLIKAII